jgi:hypothetical protein
MIWGVPLSCGFMSCGFAAPGMVRSEGLLRCLASCGLAGLTPGARPVVERSVADGVERPGAGPPVLLGPVVTPGVVEPAPLCVPEVDEPDDAPPLAAPPPLPPPPPPPPPSASATAPESSRMASVVIVRVMLISLVMGTTERRVPSSGPASAAVRRSPQTTIGVSLGGSINLQRRPAAM